MSNAPDYRILGLGHYSLLVEGRSYEVFVREEKKGYLVEVEGHLVPIRPVETQGVREELEESGPVTITSPMPGRVIVIKKKAGDAVKKGEGVLVVEAMKMENELSSPKSGKVVVVKVVVGAAVESGQDLAVVE